MPNRTKPSRPSMNPSNCQRQRFTAKPLTWLAALALLPLSGLSADPGRSAEAGSHDSAPQERSIGVSMYCAGLYDGFATLEPGVLESTLNPAPRWAQLDRHQLFERSSGAMLMAQLSMADLNRQRTTTPRTTSHFLKDYQSGRDSARNLPYHDIPTLGGLIAAVRGCETLRESTQRDGIINSRMNHVMMRLRAKALRQDSSWIPALDQNTNYLDPVDVTAKYVSAVSKGDIETALALTLPAHRDATRARLGEHRGFNAPLFLRAIRQSGPVAHVGLVYTNTQFRLEFVDERWWMAPQPD